RRLFRLFYQARIEDRRALVRRDPAVADVLGPVARDLVTGQERPEGRHLLPAAGGRGSGGRPRAGSTRVRARRPGPGSAPPRAARWCTDATAARRARRPATP